jgi:predicted 3-demethylubiquinone-9 3-methyltransferase (glyoxalase superfamily)
MGSGGVTRGSTMTTISTCLWFDGQAEEAVNFYRSVFRNSRTLDVMRSGQQGPGPQGSVLAVNFKLNGHPFVALNGGPQYAFTPAISLFIRCQDQDEVDWYWERLLEGGQPNRCGWLTDRYGLSWQVVPEVLNSMLQDRDAGKAGRAMRAMLAMTKLNIAELKRAYDG